MKNSSIIFCVMIALLLSACTSHIYYTKPELIGKIYDVETRKPISDEEGYVSFSTGINDENKITTSKEGGFKLAPVSRSYFFIKPKLDMVSIGAPQLYVNFKGYKSITLDYNEVGISLDGDAPNPGARRPEKIDVGIIYLEPEK